MERADRKRKLAYWQKTLKIAFLLKTRPKTDDKLNDAVTLRSHIITYHKKVRERKKNQGYFSASFPIFSPQLARLWSCPDVTPFFPYKNNYFRWEKLLCSGRSGRKIVSQRRSRVEKIKQASFASKPTPTSPQQSLAPSGATEIKWVWSCKKSTQTFFSLSCPDFWALKWNYSNDFWEMHYCMIYILQRNHYKYQNEDIDSLFKPLKSFWLKVTNLDDGKGISDTVSVCN